MPILKLAIIGASYLQLPLVVKAKQMGLYTICFAWAEGAVCKQVCDKFYPISIVEKEKILEICKKEKIDGICTIASDVAAPTVAYVAQKLDLVGNSYDTAIKANNKGLMRDALNNDKISCPKYAYVHNIEELNQYNWIKEHITTHQPLIVKPSDRSGSLGVMKVQSFPELQEAIYKALDYSFCHEAIVEEFVEGREISVEFISYKGKHYPLQITDKVTTGAPHFVELEHHQPADFSQEMYEKIYSLTKLALTALGITNGASHSEYRITEDGKIYVIEIGARMGGDFIGSHLVQLSTGYDFLRGVIEVALGEFQKPILSKNRYSGVYFLCKETAYLKPIILQRNMPFIVSAEIIEPQLRMVTCSSDRSGYLIYQSNNKVQL